MQPFLLDFNDNTVTLTFTNPAIDAPLPENTEPVDIAMNTRRIAVLVFMLLAYGMHVDTLIQRITAE